MISSLQFLARQTRPDIPLAVNIPVRYSAKPMLYLMKCMKKVFGYRTLTIALALLFNLQNQGTGILSFYSDSDFGGGKTFRKPRLGWIGCAFGFNFPGTAASKSVLRRLLRKLNTQQCAKSAQTQNGYGVY